MEGTFFSPAGNSDEHAHTFRLPRALEVLLGLLVVLELVAPFVTKSYGIDARFHLLWIDQFSTLNAAGILIPDWVPSGFYGFGSLTFYFYPPLTYYVASMIHVLTGVAQPTLLFQLTSELATIASFFSARALLLTLRTPRYQSLLGAVLYAFAPVRMFELYNRGALASHVAYVFLPLIWMGLLQIFQNTDPLRLRRVLVLAVSSALLALTSVGITLATGICIAIVLIVQWKQWNWHVWIEMAMAAFLTASLVVFHYAGALAAEPFSRVSSLYYPHRAGDIRLWFHLAAGTYNLLLTYGMVAVILVAFIVAHQRKEHLFKTVEQIAKTGFAVSVFILFLDCSPLSAWLWNSPLFHLIQIPWRFYPNLLLFTMVLVGVASSTTLQRAAKGVLWITALSLILPIAGVLSSWHYIDRPPEEDLAYAPASLISSNNIQSVINAHRSDPDAESDLQAQEEIRIVSNTFYDEKFETVLLTPHIVTFHRFYWPYWHLYANGSEIPSHSDSIGRATALLPSGRYIAEWRLERTPLQRAGFWISGIAWAGVILFWGIGIVRMRVKKKTPLHRDPNQSHSSPSPH